MTPDASAASLRVCVSELYCEQHARINSQQTIRNPSRTLTRSLLFTETQGLTSKILWAPALCCPQLLRTKEADLGPDGFHGVHSNCSLPSQQSTLLFHRSPRPCSTSLALYVLSSQMLPLPIGCPLFLLHRSPSPFSNAPIFTR